MKNKTLKIVPFILAGIIMLSALSGCGQSSTSTAPIAQSTSTSTTTTTTVTTKIITQTLAPTLKQVTDLIGRNVLLPDSVNKIGALVGPAYDKILILGGIIK